MGTAIFSKSNFMDLEKEEKTFNRFLTFKKIFLIRVILLTCNCI